MVWSHRKYNFPIRLPSYDHPHTISSIHLLTRPFSHGHSHTTTIIRLFSHDQLTRPPAHTTTCIDDILIQPSHTTVPRRHPQTTSSDDILRRTSDPLCAMRRVWRGGRQAFCLKPNYLPLAIVACSQVTKKKSKKNDLNPFSIHFSIQVFHTFNPLT
jgi:hypothetical protein